MRINPISQNNQSFKAVNQKYYKRAEREISRRGWITEDLLCCLRYDVLGKELDPQDGLDTACAIKSILPESDWHLDKNIELFKTMLLKQSKQ